MDAEVSSAELVAEEEAAELEAIHRPDAGDRIVRGGALRAAGYLIGTGATALSFALLLRHLGVADFGRFSTVVALMTVATGLAESGLTATGMRRFTLEPTEDGRRGLIGALVGIRLALTPIAVAVSVLFAAAVGYDSTMVIGTAVAGAGAVLVVVATSVAVPLAAELRYVALTALELTRQLAIALAVVLLVITGAALGAFFWIYALGGLVMLGVAVGTVGRRWWTLPTFSWQRWRPILHETAPLALALVINAFYLKLLIILSSLLVSDEQVGLFAAASRVTEVLVGLPTFMAGVAFPLLAHAGQHDRERLSYAMQRLAEAMLFVSGAFVVALVVGAEPIIRVFAGPGYADAVPVLQIQALALLGASLTQVWILGVVSIERRRALVWVNVVALVSVAVLGGILIPAGEAQGAALAAVLGETIMAGAMVIGMTRGHRELRPAAGRLPLFAGLLVVTCAFVLLPVSPWLAAPAAVAVYGIAAVALGLVPQEVFQALRPPRSA